MFPVVLQPEVHFAVQTDSWAPIDCLTLTSCQPLLSRDVRVRDYDNNWLHGNKMTEFQLLRLCVHIMPFFCKKNVPVLHDNRQNLKFPLYLY
jgi:hypothetical protein